jgi:hypothetical protein
VLNTSMTVRLSHCYKNVTVRLHLGPVCALADRASPPKVAVKKMDVVLGVTVLGITVSGAIN